MAEKREPYNPLLKSYPDSEKVNAVSIGAETLFTRLIAAGDDAGRYYGEPGMVLAKLFSHRMCLGQVDLPTIEKWIAEICKIGLARLYEANGKRFLQIVNPHRALRSDVDPKVLFPQPESFLEVSDNASLTQTCVAALVAPKKSETEPRRTRNGDVDNSDWTNPTKTQPNPTQEEGSNEPLSDKSDVRGAGELPPGFVAFWAAWPKSFRKQGRSKCLQHWRKHRLEKIADRVVSAVERFKSSPDWRKDAGQFIPLPMTWLNRAPWEDDCGLEVRSELDPFRRTTLTPELEEFLGIPAEAKP